MRGHLNFRIIISFFIGIKLIECLERIVMVTMVISLAFRLEKVVLLVLSWYNLVNIKILLKINRVDSLYLSPTAAPVHGPHLVLLIPLILYLLVAHSADDSFHFQIRLGVEPWLVESERVVFFYCTHFLTRGSYFFGDLDFVVH